MTNIEVPPGSGKVEAKVKAAAWAAFVVSLAGSVLLEWTATDLIPALPGNLNWLAPVLVAAVTTASTFVAGYLKRSKPDSLSESTVDAIKRWARERLPRRDMP